MVGRMVSDRASCALFTLSCGSLEMRLSSEKLRSVKHAQTKQNTNLDIGSLSQISCNFHNYVLVTKNFHQHNVMLTFSAHYCRKVRQLRS